MQKLELDEIKRKWKRKDLISLEQLDRFDIESILFLAKEFKKKLQQDDPLPSLKGHTAVALMVEPSTRTRVSFEIAAKKLGISFLSIDYKSSSIQKGESLKDTAKNLEALGIDFLILRHPTAGSPLFLANLLKISVINGGDGAHEHPTQGLLDLMTVEEHFGTVSGLDVLIVGDILHSRVARSTFWAFSKCGARVKFVGPKTMLPSYFRDFGAEISYDLDRSLPFADCIVLLRIQHERQKKDLFPSLNEYIASYGLTKERMRRCKPHVLILHPGPVERGVEIESELADSSKSAILKQVENGLAVRMAVYYLLSRSCVR
ncbi:aspartate carbamoyltransferase catalytic subunit [Candidatus Methylacidiphilum infernorum]|uniref:Aspartate carbamoyltransferase n=1 Tax=Candidatus Methylacidiphilum infernorum TaxID=511746 RepID=A0ABX7PWU8_9BACT|nr:aspartate carbamoyltransferase catalytic subunit [Candidatus Methylacidiphilum infernorum]QSR87138.1 aspartate carbamoyltransferase catalytic subunit [Candidatus Methylacidiphilum infernorum]